MAGWLMKYAFTSQGLTSECAVHYEWRRLYGDPQTGSVWWVEPSDKDMGVARVILNWLELFIYVTNQFILNLLLVLQMVLATPMTEENTIRPRELQHCFPVVDYLRVSFGAWNVEPFPSPPLFLHALPRKLCGCSQPCKKRLIFLGFCSQEFRSRSETMMHPAAAAAIERGASAKLK